MKTDPRYAWLNSVAGIPNTIRIGMSLLGVAEVVGKGSSKTILDWRDKLNGAAPAGKPIISGYSDDSVAWCGLFVAYVCWLRLKNINEVVKSPLWARNWVRYGKQANTAMLGDILVFERGKGGHVGFYIAEDATAYHVLGGNQGDKVSIVRIAKSRCVAVRRPPYVTTPKGVKPYRVEPTGILSTNEA